MLHQTMIPSADDTYDLGASASGVEGFISFTKVLNFKGATGEGEIVVPTNLADALSIK